MYVCVAYANERRNNEMNRYKQYEQCSSPIGPMASVRSKYGMGVGDLIYHFSMKTEENVVRFRRIKKGFIVLEVRMGPELRSVLVHFLALDNEENSNLHGILLVGNL